MNFNIYEARYIVVDHIVATRPRTVKMYEFVLYGNIKRTLMIDDKTYVSDPNSIVCRKPGQSIHSIGPYNNYTLTLAVDESDPNGGLISKEMMNSIPTFFHPTHVDELKKIVQRIIHTHECNAEAPTLQTDIHRFLFLLLSDGFENTTEQRQEGTSRIHVIISYIAEHYAEKLDMDYLASLIHLDKCYFIRYFKKKTGMTPQQYIIRKRLQEAKALLLRLDLPVNEITYMVGYNNVAHFISSFKKNTGLSPNQYRSEFSE